MRRKYSIIVSTYNRLKILDKTLEAITHIDYPKECFEVVVVDDCGNESAERVVQQYHPVMDITYIRNTKNLQLAASRNMGASRARHDFLVFLDNDIQVNRNVLKEIGLVYDDLGEDCCQVLNIKYTTDSLNKSQFTRYINSRHPNHRYKHKQRIMWNLFGATGCCISIETYLKCGGFDESFKTYGGEDEDYGIRLEQMGVSIILNSLAVGLHDDPCDIIRWRTKYLNSAKFGYAQLSLKHSTYLTQNRSIGYRFVRFNFLNRLLLFTCKPIFLLIERLLIKAENNSLKNFGSLNRLVIYYWFLRSNFDDIKINKVGY